MQNELLDITIIGCLVLLFASTYRKRTIPIVRAWTIGWVLILLHFTALLFHPAGVFAQQAVAILSLAALIACGIVFLLADSHPRRNREPRFVLPLIAGVASLIFVVLVIAQVTAPLPYCVAVAAGSLAWLACAVRWQPASRILRGSLVVCTAASTVWLVWGIAHGREDVGISAILAQLYLFVGLTYMGKFRRLSGGTLTVVFGLIAWACVFPAAEFCAHLGVIGHISPEFWNVPKYFVAFGMMLLLLEEEIIAASRAGKHYQSLFDANPHPMWIYDPHTLAFQGVNDAAIAQYGFSREQFLAMTVDDLRASHALDTDAGEVGRALASSDLHMKNDGSLCFVDVATHRFQSNGCELALSLVQDVTEREKMHERLLHQATHDLLTGLSNRVCLEENLHETIELSRLHDRQSALLCLDIDRFKQINDTYGHVAGDICLREVAQRLSQCIPISATAARVGGEEFALLLDNISGPEEAQQIAAGVLLALQAPIQANSHFIELTASIGIAVWPADGRDATTFWRNADCAMYRAKRAGGNQYLCMSPEMGSIASDANDMELCLKRALREGGLQVRYQPLYSITGELHGFEALVRLLDPERGLISPNRFIPIAEERGLIVALGDWVLNEVCKQSAIWQHTAASPVHIALNISPLQLTRPDFAAHVADVLSLYDLDPRLIGMEITETAMMRNLAEASRQITLLADLGISFSIDDFGTGYSSFGQLDKLPVQTLKIDRIFIDRICLSDGTYSIVDAMISMAHSLRLQVVAEGVESHAQWECLRRLKCDVVQGFLFSRPLPAEEITSFLHRGPHLQPEYVGPKIRVA